MEVENGMSQRIACQRYSVQRATLQDKLSGRVQEGTSLGRPPLLSVQQEQKLAHYAGNSLGTLFIKQQFIRHVSQYARKHKVTFKKE